MFDGYRTGVEVKEQHQDRRKEFRVLGVKNIYLKKQTVGRSFIPISALYLQHDLELVS